MIGIFAALLPLVIMYVLSLRIQSSIARESEGELEQLASDNIRQIAKDAYGYCKISDELFQKKLDVSLNLLDEQIPANGGINLLPEKVEWDALNQFSHETSTINVPKMMLGNTWFGKTIEFSQKVPLVDKMKQLAGITCTIFQKINEKGDMMRIATNVPTSSNKRAIGTYIPAVNPDGTPNAVVESIKSGRIYRGMAFVVNDWYITAYKPLYDNSGKLIGMTYVGEKVSDIKSIRDALMSIKVANSGYVFVIGGKDPNMGRYIVSKDGKRDGENIWESEDAQGKKFIQEMVINAKKLKSDSIYQTKYFWKNEEDAMPREKIAAVMYFEPWGWVIGAGTYTDDYKHIRLDLNSILVRHETNLIIVAIIVLFIVIALSLYLSARIARPIRFTNRLAEHVASGNIKNADVMIGKFNNGRQIIQTKDETDTLLEAFSRMTKNLSSLISQVHKSGIQVNTGATEINASARELETTVEEQAASTREVSATTKQIADTSQRLAETIQSAVEKFSATNEMAETGRQNLNKMSDVMEALIKATNSISSKLSVINDKANKITAIVTAINKISDHTNLLSLNAAIEAEKAGEYGKGFSVVAREISRLADQTAIATKDIERMVKEMQSSVSSGVMEMDRFGQEVRSASGETISIGEGLSQIIIRINSLVPELESVNSGIHVQSESAEQISEAMSHLNIAAEQTRDALMEFKNATSQLSDAVIGLQKEVSKFDIE